MVGFALLKFSKSISQKFWEIEKSWNVHTVSHRGNCTLACPGLYVHAKGSLVGANLISILLKGGTKIHESHSYQRKVIWV